MKKSHIIISCLLGVITTSAYALEFKTKIVNASEYKVSINRVSINTKQGADWNENSVNAIPQKKVLSPGESTLAIVDIESAEDIKTFMHNISMNAHGHKYDIKPIQIFLENINKTGFATRSYIHNDSIAKQMQSLFEENTESSLFCKTISFNPWIPSSHHPFHLAKHKSVIPINGRTSIEVIISGKNKLVMSAKKITV